MAKAIEQIVSAYVKLGNAGALEAMKALRQGLAADARARNDLNVGLHLKQIDEEIAAIDAGLAKLRGVSETTYPKQSNPIVDLRPPGAEMT